MLENSARVFAFLFDTGDGFFGTNENKPATESGDGAAHSEQLPLGMEEVSSESVAEARVELEEMRLRAEAALSELMVVAPSHPAAQRLIEVIEYCKHMEGTLSDIEDRLRASENELGPLKKTDPAFAEKQEALLVAQEDSETTLRAAEYQGRSLSNSDRAFHENEVTQIETILLRGAPGEVLVEKDGEYRWVKLSDFPTLMTLDEGIRLEFSKDMSFLILRYAEETGGIRITEGFPLTHEHNPNGAHPKGVAFDCMPKEIVYDADGNIHPEQVAEMILAGERVGLKVYYENVPGTLEGTDYERKIIALLVEGGMSREEADARVREVSGANAAHFHVEKEERVTVGPALVR